ncbi:MAG TPA: DUF885 domain-containing protein [Polyangiaceae bacterium]|nr:DUF885 domain-containing protein [Polyangiaceae bacterium]
MRLRPRVASAALAAALAALASCASPERAPARCPPPAPAGPAAAAPPRAGAPPSPEAAAFRELVEAEWEERLRENPEFATFIGDRRYNDRLSDGSEAGVAARKASSRALLAKLDAIDARRLGEDDRLNHALLRRDAALDVEGQRFPEEYLQISQLGGVHTMLATLAGAMPKDSARDYEDFLKRVAAAPAQIDHVIGWLRKGAAAGVTPPRVTLREVGAQIRAQVTADPKKSPIFVAAFENAPASLAGAERARLEAALAEALSSRAFPALTRLADYFVKEYEPKARASIGMSALPDGAAWYAFNAKQSTTTDRTPDEIHQIGLAEVERIRGEMEKVKAAAGFQGTLDAFKRHARSDAKFFYPDRESMLLAYRALGKRVDEALPKLFSTLPRLPYGVQAVPPYEEKSAPAAFYRSGALEGGRPGRFFVNTYDLKSRPRWEAEALLLHEAVPGHHLQLAVAQELTGLPKFRAYGGYGAYGEGWGLYSESLGEELGFYADPYAKFGRLTFEMWRAVRLVVDTGLHHQGWAREQALAYFRAQTGKSQHETEVEVDRYIVIPGQALSYKIGELKLKELRAHATRELGERFDVRAFHAVVLGAGPLPLDVLEARVRAWVGAQKGAGRQTGAPPGPEGVAKAGEIR